MNKKITTASLVCALLAFYFSGVGFHFNSTEQLFTGLVAFALVFVAGQKGWERFWLVVFSAYFATASFGCAFLNPGQGDGPLTTSFSLAPFQIILIAFLIGLVVIWLDEKWKSRNRFALILLTSFVFNWIVLAFNVRYFDDWKMENYLTVPFVILIFIFHRWFRLSNVSYGLIYAFMMLHIFGSHYTYSEVPFGFWLQDLLNVSRNHYDRIVHFSFGFLLAYPIREMVIRISDSKGFWSFWFPVEFVLAFSCIYELIEWAIAVIYGGDLGIAYLGSQGDVWDAQKDMFLAGTGSLIAMIVVFFIAWQIGRSDFWKEFKESFKVRYNRALGEEALRKAR